MNTQVKKISRRQERGIAALLAEPTHQKAADAAGVHLSTLRRWLKLERFREALRAARRDLLDGAVGALTEACLDAVRALRRNLTCGKPSVEVRAAIGVLTLSLRARELGEIEERIAELEKLAERQKAFRNG